MPPLRRAFALAQMHHVAVLIGQNLHFDVPRPFDVSFQIDAGIAEGRLGFGRRLLQGALQRQVVGRHAHAAAAAAGRGLDQHGKADFVGQPHRFFFVADQPIAARHDGHFGLAGHFAGRVFVAQLRHRFRRRADEVDVATAADFVEVRVLRQEAVAGMNRLHVADFGRADHAVDLQIAFGRFRRPDAIRLVGQFQIMRTAIGLAEDGDRFDAQFAAGADHPQSDFTAIGHQNAFEHRRDRSSGFGVIANRKSESAFRQSPLASDSVGRRQFKS